MIIVLKITMSLNYRNKQIVVYSYSLSCKFLSCIKPIKCNLNYIEKQFTKVNCPSSIALNTEQRKQGQQGIPN